MDCKFYVLSVGRKELLSTPFLALLFSADLAITPDRRGE